MIKKAGAALVGTITSLNNAFLPKFTGQGFCNKIIGKNFALHFQCTAILDFVMRPGLFVCVSVSHCVAINISLYARHLYL